VTSPGLFDSVFETHGSSGKISAEEFLAISETVNIADVRSPAEFEYGHIPGAFNIPLFIDREREIVGTAYKKEGRGPAILSGLELTGPSMHEKLRAALTLAKEGRLLVHCWRGGMRSEAMAWLFSLGDLKTLILNGGYKSYRHLVLSALGQKRRTIVLGGMTGSSKTHILGQIKKLGRQVIDLEDIACHKGSAFGALGQPPQPTSEYFANMVYDQWQKLDPGQPLWLEDESKNIGTVFLPDQLWLNMQESAALILMMDVKIRLPRLIEEYSGYPPEMLKAAITKISRRLGGDNTRDALEAIDKGDFAKAIEITLVYYDKAYMFGIGRKTTGNITYIKTDTDDIGFNANLLLEASEKISWQK
jgi:tRNA 2-selenouridine synthase